MSEDHQDMNQDDDLALVVQQAMEGFQNNEFNDPNIDKSHNDQNQNNELNVSLGKQQQQQEQQIEQHQPQQEHQDSNDHSNDDEFEKEIQRQLEQQFQQQDQSSHANEKVDNQAQNNNSDDNDDFAKEVERQLQQQFNQESQPSTNEQHQSNPIEHDDSIGSHIEGQIRQQLNIDESQQHQEQHVDRDQGDQYEQELQKQIMDVLGEEPVQGPVQGDEIRNVELQNQQDQSKHHIEHVDQHQDANDQLQNDFEQDLQKQIMDVFAQQGEQESQELKDQDDQEHQPAQSDNQQGHTEQNEAQDDAFFEMELQNSIMQAFSEQTGQNQGVQKVEIDKDAEKPIEQAQPVQPVQETKQHQPQPLVEAQQPQQVHAPQSQPQVQVQHTPTPISNAQPPAPPSDDQYEQDLQNQILNAFAESEQQYNQQMAQLQQIQQQQQQIQSLQAQQQQQLYQNNFQQQQQQGLPQPPPQPVYNDEIDPFRDALEQLVQNVIDAQVEPATSSNLATGSTSNEDEEIDMNTIMQNAMTMAMENPNLLLQNLNLGNSSDTPQDATGLINQLINQSTSAKGKKTVATKAKEKKIKEKKPRAPRKTQPKKKKDEPTTTTSTIVTGVSTSPFQQLPPQQPLQQLQQSQIGQINQQILPGQISSVGLTQQQHIEQLQQQVQQLSKQLQPQLPPQLQQQLQQLQNQSLSQPIIPQIPQSQPSQPQKPKPAPAKSIIDSVKNSTPLLLLTKDKSIDLHNERTKQQQVQQQKNLSIAETLAISRSNMSSGKFSSKLQEGPKEKSNTDTADSNIYPFDKGIEEVENALIMAKSQIMNKSNGKKPEEDISRPQQQSEESHSPQAVKPASPFTPLSIVPGVQSDMILNNIGSLLPNLPSNLTTIISSAITSAVNSGNFTLSEITQEQQQAQNQRDKKKGKLLVNRNETPEQQKERIRLENRERKKRWRDANKLKNQNNDLRARLKKRAIQLFGVEDTPQKKEWIEEEFEKRKNRRIIKAANLEDLATLINETLSKIDTSSLNQDSLTSIISQLVTSAFNNNGLQQQQQGGANENYITTTQRNLSPVSIDDIIPNLKSSDGLKDQAVPRSQPEQQQQQSQVQVQPPQPLSQQLSSSVLPSRLADARSSGMQLNRSSPVLPKKRRSDVLSNFEMKKPRFNIPLIPTSIKFDDLREKENEKEREIDITTETVAIGESVEKHKTPEVAKVKKFHEVSEVKEVEVQPIEVTKQVISIKEVKSKPLTKPSATIPLHLQRPIKIPSFKRPEPIRPSTSTPTTITPIKEKSSSDTLEPNTTEPSESSEPSETSATIINDDKEESKVGTPLKTESTPPQLKSPSPKSFGPGAKLSRPKFGLGLRKPPAFQGLRKPGAFQRPPDRDKKRLNSVN